MAEGQNYDLFEAVTMEVDGPDALKDLIGYALLTLSETYTPGGGMTVEETTPVRILEEPSPVSIVKEEGEPGPDYVDQDK